jgi:hypothetical protein
MLWLVDCAYPMLHKHLLISSAPLYVAELTGHVEHTLDVVAATAVEYVFPLHNVQTVVPGLDL